jgi:hypothetical protein
MLNSMQKDRFAQLKFWVMTLRSQDDYCKFSPHMLVVAVFHGNFFLKKILHFFFFYLLVQIKRSQKLKAPASSYNTSQFPCALHGQKRE